MQYRKHNLSFFFGVTFNRTVATTGKIKKVADEELEICSSYIPQNIKGITPRAFVSVIWCKENRIHVNISSNKILFIIVDYFLKVLWCTICSINSSENIEILHQQWDEKSNRILIILDSLKQTLSCSLLKWPLLYNINFSLSWL